MEGDKMKTAKIVVAIASLVGIVLFCIVAVSGKIFTLADLPLNFMSAFLGAIITTGITAILLFGQSNAEEIKERNVKVFKKKSKLYENYIEKLNQIIEKQPIKLNDFEDIKSAFYSKLVLYLRNNFQEEITRCFADLANCVERSIDDYFETDEDKAENFDKLRKNITTIINVLVKDLGLAGEININLLMDTEKKVFLELFRATLLQEVINCFSKDKDIIIKKTFYARYENEPYIMLILHGENTYAGDILIGPFVNYGMKDVLLTIGRLHLTKKRLYFRVQAPQKNPVADLYTLKDGNDNEKCFINFENKEAQSEYSEKGYIDLSYPLDNDAFEDSELDRDMYNVFIPPFSIEDSGYLYPRYHGIYLDVCKAIAKRAYYYFRKAHAISREKGRSPLPIKELCMEIGRVTESEMTDYMAKEQNMSLEDD